ncbi:hypothetical protein [Candidatus Uabimicrobium sp. HlEnr_7]|uniref:hypothetical protein n=1 Tax=Candidatus Uabimicrobium helgolandensis TaxID=3095367 RepID=UPI0035565525
MSFKSILLAICIIFLLSCDNAKANTVQTIDKDFQTVSKKGKRVFSTSKKTSQNKPPLDIKIPTTLHTATFALG